MTDRSFVACATRAREGRGVSSAIAALLVLLGLAAAGARGAANVARAQESSRAQGSSRGMDEGAASVVGSWQATLPTGLRVATLTVVPDGQGFGGAFVGYDYDRSTDAQSSAGGGAPKVSIRSGSMLTGARLAGDTFTFKVYIRDPSQSAGRPAGYELSGEVKLTGGDTAELRLSAPHKPEPLVLKLTRE